MTHALEYLDDLTRSRDRAHVDATLVASFLELLKVEKVALWRLHGDTDPERFWECAAMQRSGDLTALAGPHTPEAEESILAQEMPHHLICVERGSTVTVPDQQGEGKTWTLLPVGGLHEVDGVIELTSSQPLPADQEALALGVLKIYRNFQQLIDYSERDTLTGLFNRKGFDETFLRATVADAKIQFGMAPKSERRMPVAQRFWLGVVDVDHFKLVNDRFGHLIGDEVLVLVARLMRSTFRYLDRLYRFGGEEFVILLVAPTVSGAETAFQRLRENLANFAFPQVGRVTASIGYTDVRAGDTPQAAFERADRAVYYAKEHGRNQVFCHEQLVAEGHMVVDTSEGDVELF